MIIFKVLYSVSFEDFISLKHAVADYNYYLIYIRIFYVNWVFLK